MCCLRTRYKSRIGRKFHTNFLMISCSWSYSTWLFQRLAKWKFSSEICGHRGECITLFVSLLHLSLYIYLLSSTPFVRMRYNNLFVVGYSSFDIVVVVVRLVQIVKRIMYTPQNKYKYEYKNIPLHSFNTITTHSYIADTMPMSI